MTRQIAKRSHKRNLKDFPPLPDKLYFTIGEVSNLCLVKSYVLRYWEREFPQLRPTKRRGNRRYYQRDEVLLIRKIKKLLYMQGYTIEGARAALSQKTTVPKECKFDQQKFANNMVTKLLQIAAKLG